MILILNSGYALYDGILGALGAILAFTLLIILRNYKELWKERQSLTLWTKKLLDKYRSKMNESKFAENNTQERKVNLISPNIIYCKKCGKEISQDSSYCSFCGSKQEGTVGNLFSKLSAIKRIGLVLTGIWFVGQLILLYADNQGDNFIDNEVWFVDTDFSDYYAYGKGEFVFYAILIPAIIWGLSYIFELSKKIGFTIIVITAFAFVGYFCKGKYQQYQVEQREKAYKDSIEASENAPKINRTFVECSFGDSFDAVNKKINAIYSNDSIVTFWGVRNGSPTYDNTITVYDVVYGNRTYNNIKFNFHKKKFVKICFEINYNSCDSKKAAYDTFTDMFNEKNYPHDKKDGKYANTHYYSDKYTRLKLRYSVPEFDGENEKISIEYYDKTSGMEDSGL